MRKIKNYFLLEGLVGLFVVKYFNFKIKTNTIILLYVKCNLFMSLIIKKLSFFIIICDIIIKNHSYVLVLIIMIFLLSFILGKSLCIILNLIHKIENNLNNKPSFSLTRTQLMFKFVKFSFFLYLIKSIYLNCFSLFIFIIPIVIGFIYLKRHVLKKSLIHMWFNKLDYLKIVILSYMAINLIITIHINLLIPILAIFSPDLAENMELILTTTIFAFFFKTDKITLFDLLIKDFSPKFSDKLIFDLEPLEETLRKVHGDKLITDKVNEMIKPIVNNIKDNKDFRLLLELDKTDLPDDWYVIRNYSKKGLKNPFLVEAVPYKNTIFNDTGNSISVFKMDKEPYASIDSAYRLGTTEQDKNMFLCVEIWKKKERNFFLLKYLNEIYIHDKSQIININTDIGFLNSENKFIAYDPCNLHHGRKSLLFRLAENSYHDLRLKSMQVHKGYQRMELRENTHLLKDKYTGKAHRR